MAEIPVAINGGFLAGEEIIERLDISEGQPGGRKQRKMLVGFGVFALHRTFVAAMFDPFKVVGWLPLVVLMAMIGQALSGPFFAMFPPAVELLITNKRLHLRYGVHFEPWVADYGSAIEIVAIDDPSGFSIRPTRPVLKTGKVFVSSDSPLLRSRQMTARLRAFSSEYLALTKSDSVQAVAGTASSTTIPPGIILLHCFLTNQLRSTVAAIPTNLLTIEPQTIPKSTVQEPSDLGIVGYKFGVE